MNKMLSSEMTKLVAEGADVSQTLAKRVITCYLEAMRGALTRGMEITMPGLGKFTNKTVPARGERMGCNPSTGEKMLIPPQPAYSKPVFKVSAPLKAEIKEKTMDNPFV